MASKEQIFQNFKNDFSIVLRNKIDGLELSKLIFLCIGTDRIIGDSFGPLVGYKLKELFSKNENIQVIGDLENPITLSNVESIINNIYTKYEEPFVIAIDAAVSNKREIGSIVVTDSKMNVASNCTRRKIYIGDTSIKGVIAKDLGNARCNFRLLQSTPLSLVMNMADIVSQGIYDVINI